MSDNMEELLNIVVSFKNYLLQEPRYELLKDDNILKQNVFKESNLTNMHSLNKLEDNGNEKLLRLPKKNKQSNVTTYNDSPLNHIDESNLIDPQKTNDENYYDLYNSAMSCRLCQLCETRNNVVFSAGTTNTSLAIIGEAPGADEDIKGFPFVGRAGQLLDKMLEAIHLTREVIYICNVIKCRPPQNRTPLPSEIKVCSPYLLAQIKLIKPKIILALGNPSAQYILNTSQGITQLRGKVYEINGITVLPSYHPAYLLRNPVMKKDSWDDLKLLRILLDDLKKQGLSNI